MPTLNVQTTNAKALKHRQDLEDEVCVEAAQADDPWLLFLRKEYVGKICFLNDIAERHKLYRVRNIAYWTRNKARFSNWEATIEPVHLKPSGMFEVADEDTILGPSGVRITKSKVLLGYILAQYIDGDEEEPTRSDCVDLYIENAIDKLKAYLFKLQQIQSFKKSKGMRPAYYLFFFVSITYASLHPSFLTPQMAPKKKPPPLARSLKLIAEERVNVARRTRERVALLFTERENSLDLDIATTTDIPMREVHGCLNLCCFCLLLLCLNLLFLQRLYLYKV